MGINISIDGIDGLQDKFNDLINGEKMENALARSGELVRSDAVENCAEDTGHLRASITSEVDGNTANIGTNVLYAVYVEFGTGKHSTKGGRQTPWTYKDPKTGKFHTTSGQKPQPFLVPALLNNQDKVQQIFKEEFSK